MVIVGVLFLIWTQLGVNLGVLVNIGQALEGHWGYLSSSATLPGPCVGYAHRCQWDGVQCPRGWAGNTIRGCPPVVYIITSPSRAGFSDSS